MTDMEANWKAAFSARDDLEQYGDNAIGLFALSLRFTIDDVHSTAADSITDGSDDKKCDIIFIDKDEYVAVIAQCYMASRDRFNAPANKAADLNTAIAWLLQRPISELPERLRSAAKELRSAVEDDAISRLEVWYVHNLSESQNVKDELKTVEATVKSVLQSNFSGKNISISGVEIGAESFEGLYQETLSPILVGDEFKIEIESGFSIRTDSWQSYVTAIPAKFLHQIFKKHGTRLFSANVRDYLGSRNSDTNINNGIKNTAEMNPEDFWVYNNGITVLTHNFEEKEYRGNRFLKVRGISIVNGAQTTGAIGSLRKRPHDHARVPARFVQTKNSDVIYNIIQYNNSQNKVTASDFRSTDRVQKRLREEVELIPDAKYEGGRRGGHKDIIERNKNLLPSYTVGQALAAFHQDPGTAYNSKSEIWISDRIYSKYFNDDITGAHIVFCYSLLRSIEEKKRMLVQQSKLHHVQMTTQEADLLAYFRNRGSIYLFMSAVASCMETFVSSKITNQFRLSFGLRTSPKQASVQWCEIVNVVSPFTTHLIEAIKDGLKSNERAQKSIATFRSLVQATSSANSEAYKKFSKYVIKS